MGRRLFVLFATALFLAACPTDYLIEEDGGAGGDGGAPVDGGGDGGVPGDGGVCRDSPVFGLQVFVRDQETQQPICDAQVAADDGAQDEPLQPNAGAGGLCFFYGVIDRGGSFDVTATALGYAPVTLPTTVSVDSCGLPLAPPVTLNFTLAPARADAGVFDAGGL